MQVPDVMHVPWRTKYGHKDSCLHHNKFYKTWIISGTVIWHPHSIYEYDHVHAIIVLTSCKADAIHVTHMLVALVTKLMTLVSSWCMCLNWRTMHASMVTKTLYETWIISGSVIWHPHSFYEYDHVPAIIVLTSCKADAIHVTHMLVALVTKLMTLVSSQPAS